MIPTSYNEIAEWYDQYIRERPVYSEAILPCMMRLVGDVHNETICDLACGQGYIARELARRGAKVTGVDLAPKLLEIAQRYEAQDPLGVRYLHGDAQSAELLEENSFTGCVCVVALMNIPDLTATFRTVHRMLQPQGWFCFAISHPCFDTPQAEWITLPDPEHPIGRVVTGYFDERLWLSTRVSQDGARGVRGRVVTITACSVPISTLSPQQALSLNAWKNHKPLQEASGLSRFQAIARSRHCCLSVLMRSNPPEVFKNKLAVPGAQTELW